MGGCHKGLKQQLPYAPLFMAYAEIPIGRDKSRHNVI